MSDPEENETYSEPKLSEVSISTLKYEAAEKSKANLYRVPKLDTEELTQAILKEYTVYDPDTGIFTLIKSGSPRNKNSLPMRIGTLGSSGYLRAMVAGKKVPLHVMAVIYMTGKAPDRDKLEVVDHINGDKSDNRWVNLRVISSGENIRNQKQLKNSTKSGVTGVNQRGSKFYAHIRIDTKLRHLGSFATLEEAVAARQHALKEHLKLVDLHHDESQISNNQL